MTQKEFRKQEIAKKMKNLRIEAKLTQQQVAEKLGITYQAVSNYERGKNSIETDLLLAMCEIYNADPISVLSPDGKSEIYDVLYSEEAPLSEKCLAALGLLRIYFARSIGSKGYRFDHPQFDDYVAMLLNQNQFKKRFGTEIYNILVQKYGKQPGIPEGKTTYQIEKTIIELQQKKKKAPLYSSEAMKLAQDYDSLDSHGQRVVRLVADEEKARCIDQSKKKTAKEPAAEKTGTSIGLEKVIRFSIPGYAMPLSAGTGQEAGQEYPENYTLVKEPPRGTSFIARVSGNSMEPTYHDGDLVFVHSAEEILVGKIGAFLMDGQQWIKERGDGELISHNPKYPPRSMTEDVRCQGLVLGVCDESYFE